MIRTPTDLLGYLRYIAEQHPYVQYVIHGDEMRVEEATLSRIRYPLVDIEVPTQTIPLDNGPATMSTRIYVTSRSQQGHAYEDIQQDRCHTIALHIIRAIKEHAEAAEIGYSDADLGITITAPIQLRPVVMQTSDLVKGWMFELTVSVNQEICLDLPYRPASLTFPYFSWVNTGVSPSVGDITLTDHSIASSAPTLQWWWAEEREQPTPAVLVGDNITLANILNGPEYRTVQVWLAIALSDRTLWAYAHIDTRLDSGYSTPYPPFLPV